jgi:magnesium-protoporphyrin IX monomethyl ester (oxidative) cyclase
MELDIHHKRWLPNLRRMRDAFGQMDAGKRQGGVGGWITSKLGAAKAGIAFVKLYTIPVIKSVPPENVRLEPTY